MIALQPAKKTYQSRQKSGLYRYMLLCLLALGVVPAHAVPDHITITIGAGSGVVWEGLPFNDVLMGPMYSSGLIQVALVSIGTKTDHCALDNATKGWIDGVLGIQLTPGVIIVPRATVSGHFFRYRPYKGSKQAMFSGTIGLPANNIVVADTKIQMHKFNWCFAPEGDIGDEYDDYYDAKQPRVVNYAGNWIIIANGKQVSRDNIAIPPFYFGSYGEDFRGNRYKQILPTSVTLRVSALQCTVATRPHINFGQAQRKTQRGEQLAIEHSSLNVSCNQPTDQIDANINVQFRALKGHFESTPAWLALDQGGGYITGEIDGGVTGSGACSSTRGIPFDGTRLKVGNITATEKNKTTNNQVTWRLCSGGASLPTGAVSAATEMLVTFN